MRFAVLEVLLIGAVEVLADPPEAAPCVYLIDPRPVAQTPKYLGVNVEVMQHAQRANVWDWLADSGVGMVRVGHPDTNLRKAISPAETAYFALRSRDEFEAFRARLLNDPERNTPWTQYRFSEEVPWLGTPDLIVEKLNAIKVKPILSMAYAPNYFARPLLTAWGEGYVPSDASIDWGAAASGYEYYFACIWRYATKYNVTHYMMMNEPPGDEKTVRQVGVLARMARLALEDVRAKLPDAKTSAALCLSGPACYMNWEEYWPYVEPYVDFLDVHLYEPDPDLFARKLSRALTHARLSGRRTLLTEFNRVGGPMPPEESLFGMRPSLQVAGLLMAALQGVRPGDPGLEAALLYQFQFPATHRNFKSLVYGDMNLVDWTGQDQALRKGKEALPPSSEALQLRFATPAYHMLKMAARCVPGTRSEQPSYEVFELGEANRGVGAVSDPINRRNVYPSLELNKYYAHGGGGTELRTLAVRTEERLIVLVANPEPVTVKAVGFDVGPLGGGYATAVVRETSLWRRDQAVAQLPVASGKVKLDIPPESLTQLIFVKEALAKIEELKVEESSDTPGDSRSLGLHETTRLRALGRVGKAWIDLTELNVVWSSSAPDGVRIYQGGLTQRVGGQSAEATVAAKTLGGVEMLFRVR
jgi:hypothetical protein